MVDFSCSKCRKGLTARYVDMQLPSTCPGCKIPLTIPDKRPDEERRPADDNTQPMREAWFMFIFGTLLLVVATALELAKSGLLPLGKSIAAPEDGFTFPQVIPVCFVAGILMIGRGIRIHRHRKRMR